VKPFLLLTGLLTAAALRATDTTYLFTYFTGNGEDGLHLAWSADGYRWQTLNDDRSILAPQVGKDRLMRDPCVTRGPDGTYHLVWTTGWWDRSIGHASTRDFLSWSKQTALPVMEHKLTARNAWAPEAFWDAKRGRFLIFWASTVPGAFPQTVGALENDLNHRIYATTTIDWTTLEPTRLFCDPGFSVIDATLWPTEDGGYHLIVKDETDHPPRKNLRIGTADDPEGPWVKFAPPFTRDWVEGPTAIKVGTETIVYFDIYREQHYGAMRSRDLVQWEDVTAEISVPRGARHGTMIAVPRSLVDRLREVWPSPVRLAAPAVVPAPDSGANPEATARLRDPKLPTVFIAGDSTAAKNNGAPIQGWGEPFHDYFDPAKINVVNGARGGRSSRTFITEGLWDALLAEVKAGDFVLIQFGHNDAGAINAEPPGSPRPLRARGSLPGLGDESEEIENVLTHRHEVVHTFGWYVWKMIADVKARGATPIVLSLTVRNIWTGGKVERRSGEYRAWAQAIARSSEIDFVDLTRILADRYQEIGEEKTRAFFATDHTHTVPAGADFNAAAVVAGLKGLRGGPWGSCLSAKGSGVPADTIGWLNLPEPANPALPTLLLIGDSTVRNGCGDGAGGQWGWGDALPAHCDISKLNVANRAVGGLSSRTFLTQGHWERALTLLKRGDYLLMQFGHNDDSALNDEKRARGTIKGVGEETQEIDNQLTKQHETVHSYGWYLRRFVREAKARGVTPIVCSPVPRKEWKDGNIVRSAEGYAGWSRQVAAEEGTTFIDLNDLVAHRYEALGAERVEAMFADEHTHTSRAGAELTAAVVADALRKLPGSVFLPYLRGP
jgi:lysophospholipase L1-like esterase